MRSELALATLVALAATGAACTSGDDDDVESIPACQVLWASLAGPPDTYDVYLIEMPEEMWTPAGTRTFSIDEDVYGMFYDDFNETGAEPTWARRAVAVGGTFTVTSSAAAPAPAGTIQLTDDGLQEYFDLGFDEVVGASLGSGGSGSFSGEWSPDGSTPPVPGTGTIAITILGSSLNVGGYVSYAQCFDPSGSSIRSASTAARALPRFPKKN